MRLIGIFLYLLVLLAIGAYASRRMKDLRDYYAGGKRFGFLAAAFSSRATGESAWLLIGLTGMGAAFGAQALWTFWVKYWELPPPGFCFAHVSKI